MSSSAIGGSLLPWTTSSLTLPIFSSNLSSSYLTPKIGPHSYIVHNSYFVVYVIRASTKFHPSEQILNHGSEFSFADGIDYWVTHWAGNENTRCDQYGVGWDLNALDKTAEKTFDQEWKITQQKRSDDNYDIYGCLAFNSSSWCPFLLHFRCGKASDWDHFPVCVNFRRLVHRPVQE